MSRDQRERRERPIDRRCSGTVGCVGGIKGHVTDVREESGSVGTVRIVREERFDLPIPSALREKGVKSLFVKCNAVEVMVQGQRGETFLRSQCLVITFREAVQGIVGLPETTAKARKLQRLSFTHVTIECLDDEAPDRFRIVWWKPKSGHRHAHEKGGEEVWSVCDDLSALQWIAENDLSALYDLRVLETRGFLPMRDEERDRLNAIAAQCQTLFGHASREIPAHAYHRARLIAHFLRLHDEDEQAAIHAMQNTVVGRSVDRQLFAGTFSQAAYYVSESLHLAYAIWNLPDARYVAIVDLRQRSISIEQMKVDVHGLDVVEAYHSVLTNQAFRKVDVDIFRSITAGIGSAWQPAAAGSSINA